MAIPQPAEVVWTIRRGLEALRKTTTPAGQIAVLPLQLGSLPPGRYQLEASAGQFIKYLNFETAGATGLGSSGPLISYNANLSPAFRYTLIGEQQVLRGQVQEARRIFEGPQPGSFRAGRNRPGTCGSLNWRLG